MLEKSDPDGKTKIVGIHNGDVDKSCAIHIQNCQVLGCNTNKQKPGLAQLIFYE
jgi:hypothetical protein